MLEAIRQVDPTIRFYQASSSEMFGKVREVPQTETTPFYPRSPYGVAKAYGHFLTVNYRESYGMHARLRHPVQPRVAAARPRVRHTQGDRRRGPHRARPGERAADGQPRCGAGLGLCRGLRAGDVADAPAARAERLRRRDRGGRTRSASCAGSRSSASDSTTSATSTSDPALFRPAEVDHLLGDSSRARTELGWEPTVDFRTLIEMMVDADVARLRPPDGSPVRPALVG